MTEERAGGRSMASCENQEKNSILWRDRKHFMWFPFSFTVYELKKNRLYEQTGLLSTNYEELLLYRVIDLTMQQTFAQKLFGTGTIILHCKADASSEVRLENIRRPKELKEMLSDMIEEARARHRVVGKEFYGGEFHTESDMGTAEWGEGIDGE